MRSRERERGFTLVEVLLAVTLVALLLLSVAAALHASFDSYRVNETLAAGTQAARSALGRMTRDIRNAEALDVESGVITVLPPDEGNWPDRIQYRLENGTLYYARTVGSTETENVLVGGDGRVLVKAFDIDHRIGADADGMECVKTVSIRLVLEVDGQARTVSASVSPRRSRTF